MRPKLFVALAFGLIALAGTWGFYSPAMTAPQSPKVVEIAMHARQWEYGPGLIEVNRGDTVRIKFLSMDVAHGFYLDGYGIQQDAEALKPVTIEFVADKPGRWMYRCSVACGTFHPYMIGWFRVKPNWYAGTGWTLSVLAGLGMTGYFLRLGVKSREGTPPGR